MKYLVTVRRRDGGPAPPPEALAGMLLTQRDWLQEKLDDGTFDVSYGFAQGGVGIVNADSRATRSVMELLGRRLTACGRRRARRG
jgi:hypothetical protein